MQYINRCTNNIYDSLKDLNFSETLSKRYFRLIKFQFLLGIILNLFLHSVACYIETSHLICTANQMTGFYTECNTGLNWVNLAWRKK